MSTTIDNKVVEMSFDNSKFESGVKTSISTLDRLKEALNFDRSTSTFKNLEAAANGIDVSGATNSFSELASKILSLTPAITIVQDLTRAAEGLVKSLASNTIGKVIKGGFKRSSNLQDARFMLEGLKVEWNDILEDIEYGVNDTAYGLDAAAKAASSLVASGVNIGDDMKQSLRGISGVAAMTNSSYEEISSIFTTVAGQGKVMTMQLRQLETRGMNAAATLGEYLGKSEAAVREMVTKGEIDFATFSAAMDTAFGEHAKDSNKTLQGVLSNIGSALSRVGQRFIEPIIANEGPLVNMLNAVRIGINEINAALEPISSKVVPFLTNEKMTGVLDKITIKIRGLTSGWNQVSQIFGNVGISTSDLTSRLYTLYEGTDKGTKFEEAIKNTKAFKDQLEKLGGEAKDFSGEKLINFIKGTDAMKQAIGNVGIESKDLTDILISTSQGLRDQAKAGGENAAAYEKQADKIDQLLNNIKEGTVSLDEVVKAFNTESPIQIAMNGVVSIFNAFRKVLHAVGKAFKNVFGHRNIASAESLASAFEKFGNFVANLIDQEVFDQLIEVFEGLFSIIDLVCEIIFGSFKLAFTIVQSLFGVTSGSALDLASNTGSALKTFHDFVIEGNYISGAFENIGKWITFVIDSIKGLINKVKELPIVQEIFESVKNTAISVFGKVKDLLSELYGVLTNVNSISFSKLNDEVSKILNSNFEESGLYSFFSNFSKTVDDSSEEAAKSTGGFISKVTGVLSTFKDKVKDVVTVNYKDIFGIGAVVMIIITLNNFGKVLQTLIDICPSFGKALDSIVKSTTNVIDSVKSAVKLLSKTGAIKVLASAFKDLAIGLIVLSGAIVILGKIKWQEALQGVLSLVVTIGVLAGSLTILIKSMSVASLDTKGLLVIVGAIGILSVIGSALVLLSSKIEKVNWTSLLAMLGSLLIICAELAGTLWAIDKLFSTNPLNALNTATVFIEASGAIFIMAGALAVLSKITIDKSIIGKLAALAGIGIAEIAVFKALSHYLEKPLDKSSILGMLAVPLALLEYAVILKALGKMDFTGVNIGQIVGITLGLVTLVGLLSLVSKRFIGLGRDLLALAAAVAIMDFVIKSFKKLQPDQIWGVLQGCIAVFASIMGLAAFINLAAGKELPKLNKSLLELAGAIALMSISVKIFGSMDAITLLKGVPAVGALIFVLSLLISASNTVNVAKSTLISIGVLIAELAAIVLIFKIVADGTNDVLKAAGALGIMIAGLSALMYMMNDVDKISLKAIGSAAAGIVFIGLLGAIMAVYYKIGGQSEGAIKIATAITILLGAMIGSIKLLTLVKGDVENAIAPMVGMIAVTALVATVIGILTATIGDKADSALKIAGSISILLLALSASLVILSVAGSIGTVAWGAIAQIGVILVALFAIIEILGLLDQKNGTVKAGIDVITYLVDSVGTVLIDLIKKVAQGAIDIFVALGEGLSDFWEGVSGFVDGMKNVSGDVVTGAKNLVALMGLLGAAGFIQAVESVLGIEPDLDDLKSTLSKFAEAMVEFSNGLGDNFNADTVSKAALAGQTLMSLINNLPSNKEINKLKSWVNMEGDDPSKLGVILGGLASALNSFQTGLGTEFNAELALTAAQAGQTLMSLATNLPSDKELTRLQTWFSEGAIDFENFGTQLASFGSAMKTYSDTVKEIDTGAIDASITCGKSLAKLAKSLPAYDGTVKEWFGGKKVNFDAFGTDLESFADHLVKYSKAVSAEGAINVKAMDASATIGNTLSKLANSLPSYGGKIQEWFGGKKSTMDEFGKQIETFGKKFASYSDKIKDVNGETVKSTTESIVKAVNKLNELSPKVKDSKNLVDVGDNLKKFADKMETFSNKLGKVDVDKVNNLAKAIDKLLASLKTASNNTIVGMDSMYKIGTNAAQGFINGVISKLNAAANAGSKLGNSTKNALKKALDIHSPSKVFEKLGEFTSEGFINGLSGVVSKASAVFTNLKTVAETRFSGIIGDISKAITSGINGQSLTITPVLDLSEIQNGVGNLDSILGDYSNIGIGSSFDLSSITASGMNGFNPNSKFDSLAETIKGISSGNVTNEFNNTFDVSGYTGSTDELASRISELLQEQVERNGAVWA